METVGEPSQAVAAGLGHEVPQWPFFAPHAHAMCEEASLHGVTDIKNGFGF